jgi:hypothetical protein
LRQQDIIIPAVIIPAVDSRSLRGSHRGALVTCSVTCSSRTDASFCRVTIIAAIAAIWALGFLSLALALPPQFLCQIVPDDGANQKHQISNGKVYE